MSHSNCGEVESSLWEYPQVEALGPLFETQKASIRTWGLWSSLDDLWFHYLSVRWQNVSAPRLSQGWRAVSDMASIPAQIHQIWLGEKPIPSECVEWMKGWKLLHSGPHWSYKLWTDSDIGTSIKLRRQDAYDSATNPAHKSDILRLEILYQFGGVCCDVDFECLKCIAPLTTRLSWFASFSNTHSVEVNNSIIGAAPKHPLTLFLLDRVACPWEEWGEERFLSKGHMALRCLKRFGFLLPNGSPFEASSHDDNHHDIHNAHLGDEAKGHQTQKEARLASTLNELPNLRIVGGSSEAPSTLENKSYSFLESTGPGFITRATTQWLMNNTNTNTRAPDGNVNSSLKRFPQEDFQDHNWSSEVAVLPNIFFHPIPNSGIEDRTDGSLPSPRNNLTLAIHHWKKTWQY